MEEGQAVSHDDRLTRQTIYKGRDTWTIGTIRIQDPTTARTHSSLISAFRSMLALFSLYQQNNIFHVVGHDGHG